MTDRPILFSSPMIRALLDGRKTQTRRLLPVQPSAHEIASHRIGGAVCDPAAFPDRPYVWLRGDDGSPVMPIINPPRVIQGDRLWVREAWQTVEAHEDVKPSEMGGDEPILYVADDYVERWGWPGCGGRWGRKRPGMFMPRWAHRLTLTVTDVRVQWLQDISESDSLAEGVGTLTCSVPAMGESITARDGFRDLWNSLNEARGYGWDTNPVVCAYTFTVERKNIDAKAA